MTLDPRDDIDRAVEEVLASVVAGEPRRVNAASVRKVMAERRSSRLPVWLAAAAVLVVGLAVGLRELAPVVGAPVSVARSVEAPAPVEVRPTPSPDSLQTTRTALARSTASRRLTVATTTDPLYEGLPRLTIASIVLPEPLFTSRLEADPIQTPRIEIAPLSVASLSTEQEHK